MYVMKLLIEMKCLSHLCVAKIAGKNDQNLVLKYYKVHYHNMQYVLQSYKNFFFTLITE